MSKAERLFAANIAVETPAFGRGHWDNSFGAASAVGEIWDWKPRSDLVAIATEVTEEGAAFWVAIDRDRVHKARWLLSAALLPAGTNSYGDVVYPGDDGPWSVVVPPGLLPWEHPVRVVLGQNEHTRVVRPL